MKNEEFLNQLKERLAKEFKYMYQPHENINQIKFYNHELNEVDKGGYKVLNGLVAHLEETYRHNGTKENVSCEVSFINWKNDSGHTYGWIKIRQGASERQINNFVKKVVNRYNELLEEIKKENN